MVRLATADGPDALCLQEVPVWALSRLEGWGGMQSFGVVASRPKLISAELGRLLTELNHGFFRSAFTGQANAILLAPALRPVGKDSIVLNPRSFRRAEANQANDAALEQRRARFRQALLVDVQRGHPVPDKHARRQPLAQQARRSSVSFGG